MSKLNTVILTLTLCMAGTFASAQSKPSLRDVEEIESTLFVVALANEVDRKCETISGRRIKGYNVLLKLRNKANDLGYSDKEIRAYVESDQEKARMRAKGEAYLKQRGVDTENPETYCTFGRAEIANSSAIGALLKAR